MTAPVVFSNAWFARHQRTLLTLLNAPVIGGEFRAALAIRRGDAGGDSRRRIVRLLPHGYILDNRDGTYTADFRTHRKFAKRLYYEFAPLWKAAHTWDRFVANPLVPALNLGFDSLTVYPDPDPESTTVDGWAGHIEEGATWATLRNGAGTTSVDSISYMSYEIANAAGAGGTWVGLRRMIFLFDTSSLGAAMVITAATFTTAMSGKSDANNNLPDIDLYTSAPASNTSLTGTDYATCGTTSQTGAAIPYGSIPAASPMTLTLNATGRASITPNGITKFALRNANYDVANVAPTWAASTGFAIQPNFADSSGTADDPKLVVTYAAPVGGFPFAHLNAGSGISVADQRWKA